MKTERANDRAKDNGKNRGNTFKNVFHEPKVLDPAIIASRQEAQAKRQSSNVLFWLTGWE